MTCEEYRALLDRLLDGEATPAEEEALRRHEAECPDCAALRAEMTGLMDLLRDGDDVPPMPEDLHNQWVQAVRAEAPAAPAKEEKKERVLSMAAFRRQWMRWGATAALALLVLGGTLLTWDSFDKAKTRTAAMRPAVTAAVKKAEETTPQPEVQALASGADDLAVAADETVEEAAEEPAGEAEVFAETADHGTFGEALFAAMRKEEPAPAESAAEEAAWDMDAELEEDTAWETNGVFALNAYPAEEQTEAKTFDLAVPTFTAMPSPIPAATSAPTPAQTLTSTPVPTFTPTSESAGEPAAEPTPEVVTEPAKAEEESGTASAVIEESRPKQWIGWIALAAGGVLALVVLAVKYVREQRKSNKS